MTNTELSDSMSANESISNILFFVFQMERCWSRIAQIINCAPGFGC